MNKQRTREEIEIDREYGANPDEVLLDIRDALTKEESEETAYYKGQEDAIKTMRDNSAREPIPEKLKMNEWIFRDVNEDRRKINEILDYLTKTNQK